jgi:VIT1/CCC1 family predicted Fe2+/Mn2+ transporter
MEAEIAVANHEEINFYIENLKDEQNSSYLYGVLADLEQDSKISEVYHRLADTEANHARTWTKKLEDAGVVLKEFKPSLRTRFLAWIARRIGPAAVLPTLMSMEYQATTGYNQPVGDPTMASVEQSHARLLRAIRQTGWGGMSGGALAQLEGRHRSAGGNALRAAVLGANDGLVSNFSLVMGVAGAAVANSTILLTGIAGLLAGAISMALGEWISVQSSRELYENQIRTEKLEIEQSPEEEAEELALIYQARGLDEQIARQLSQRILSNPENALDTLAREELGVDPQELGGSAWEAALTSFILFAIGAIIPVIPYIFLSGSTAVMISSILSAAGLFLIGVSITLFTGRSVLSSGIRQMIFGLAAAGVTYLIGRLIGVSIGG